MPWFEPDRPLTRADNYCRSCGLNFASEKSFDKHRVGSHDYTYHEGLQMEPLREDGRRCKTLSELNREGWRVNAYGRWTHRPPNSFRGSWYPAEGKHVVSREVVREGRHEVRGVRSRKVATEQEIPTLTLDESTPRKGDWRTWVYGGADVPH